MDEYTINEKVENAIKWIDGLKTTKVKQGHGQLGDSKTGYCCLGYGCMKLGLEYDSTEGVSNKFQNAVGLINDEGSRNDREPLKIMKLYNVDTLIEANDDHNYSFRRISTLIKKNLDGLFEEPVANNLILHYDK